MRVLFGVIGVIVVLFSALMLSIAVVELAGGGDGKTQPSILVGIAVFFSGATAAGGYLAWRMFRGSRRVIAPPTSADAAEKRVLALAAKLGGRITVPEVAGRCGLTIAESREVLDRLASQGVAEILVARDGTIVYAISGLLTADAKAAATDPVA